MQSMETLILEFGEIDDSAVSKVELATVLHYSNLIQTYTNQSVNSSVSIRNIGKGADWSVIVLTITSIFFIIPEAQKKIRESVEEWQSIFKELKSIYSWIVKKKTALYPNQYLFLIALNSVVAKTNNNEFVFLGFKSLPEENPDLDKYPSLLFSFVNQQQIYQVAISRTGVILWENQLQVLLNAF